MAEKRMSIEFNGPPEKLAAEWRRVLEEAHAKAPTVVPEPGLGGWAEWRAFWLHNFLGHAVGYCLVWPISPRLAQWLHDRTIPRSVG